MEHRPLGVRRPDRRDLHRLRQRLGDAGASVSFDDIALPDGTEHVVREWLDGWAITFRRRAARPTQQLHPHGRVRLPRRQRHRNPHSLLLLRVEGVSIEDERNAVMGRAIDYLLE